MALINNRFKIDRLLGKGSFGEVYIGYDQQAKHLVAIKVADKSKAYVLQHEYQIYLDLMKSSKPPLIPTVYWYGTDPVVSSSTYMVMKYLGHSLEYLLHTYCGGKFSLKTTLIVSIQIFDLLLRLHSCGYVHRDIKPDNFLIGVGHERSKIFLIDFGLAKRFKNDDRVHIKPCDNKKLTGTARYASINSHRRLELSRRDDLESLGYLMIYFLKGKLPWQGTQGPTKEAKYELIGEIKASYSLKLLCEGLPIEIYLFIEHVKSLEFKQKPDYHYLRSQLIAVFNRMGYDYDCHYDWEDQINQAQTFHSIGAPIN